MMPRNGIVGNLLSCRYPPGHGDLLEALHSTGMLEQLLEEGIDYVFVSNIDNLGATVDLSILSHIISSEAAFVMEVTDKTRSDVKGGTLVEYEGELRLLEFSQVPQENRAEFIKKFRIFNTNNIWIKISAIKELMDSGNRVELDLIVNPKQLENTGEKVLQLETAIGSAIRYFKGSHAVNVPRSRFLPVKTCSDLLLVQSDLYTMSNGKITLNSTRPYGNAPVIKLGKQLNRNS